MKKIVLLNLRRINNDSGGQGLIFVAITLFTLICLLALVINVGHRITKKIEMQNAADAAAVSGAIWTARGLNTISILNVSMTECLAFIIFIEAIHISNNAGFIICAANLVVAGIACFFGAAPACKWAERLASIAFPGLIKIDKFYHNKCEKMKDHLWSMMEKLKSVEDFVKVSFPVVQIASAYSMAQKNGAQGGLLLPPRITLPVEDGEFKDLCYHTKHGGSGYRNFLCIDNLLQMRLKYIIATLWLMYPKPLKGPDTAPLVPPVSVYYLLWGINQAYNKICPSGGGRSNPPKPLVLIGQNKKNKIKGGEEAWKKKMDFIALVETPTENQKIFRYITEEKSYKFGDINRDMTVAVAQVKVYNPTDQDLFNQDWHVKLVPFNPDDIDVSLINLLSFSKEVVVH